MLNKAIDLFTKSMSIGVIAAGVLGIVHPSAFFWFSDKIPYFLGVVMLGMGMSLTSDDFKTVIKNPRAAVIGTVLQFTIMPAIAYFLVKIFSLPPDIGIGIILLGACPGATASSVITYLAKGNVALSVSLTMVTTLLAPIATPLLVLLLAGTWIKINFFAMMISIIEIVVVPVSIGILFNRFFAAYCAKIRFFMPAISTATIIILVGTVVSLSADVLINSGLLILAVVIIHNLCGLFLGYVSAKFFISSEKDVRTTAISVGMKNSGLAASLAVIHFTAAGGIPAAIFSVWHNVSGSLFATYIVNKDNKRSEAEHVISTAQKN